MRRLKRMELDFTATDSAASWSGVLALIAGVAVAGVIVADYQHLLARAARLEAELGRLAAPRRAAESAVRDARKHGEAVVRGNEVAHELSRRWDRVFLALESARTPNVALLAIEPDPRKGVLKITAEAKGKNAMLDYVDRLQSAQPLQRVMLESHEVQSQVAEKPVRFIVTAAWKSVP
jgi:Tfp pilus assembly protein PilN